MFLFNSIYYARTRIKWLIFNIDPDTERKHFSSKMEIGASWLVPADVHGLGGPGVARFF